MPHSRTALIALSLITSIVYASEPTVFELNDMLSPGINLGNCLEPPADGSWERSVPPTIEVVDEIASCGFASIRIPVRWSDYTLEEPPYTIDPDFLELVDTLIDRSLEKGMIAMINDHHYNAFYEDPVGELPRFLSIWEQLSEHYKDYPREKLFFEILNEPHGNMTQEVWETIYPTILLVIRKHNPERPIILGGYPWGGYKGLLDLDIVDDENLIAAFHYYEPFPFTHQGAGWIDPVLPTGIRFEANSEEVAQISLHFGQVKAWAEKEGVPVIMGEFGAYETADIESRILYTRTVRKMAETFGFSWQYWEFGSGFGIWNPATDEYNQGLRDALLAD